MTRLNRIILQMGRTIRALDIGGDHIELWANDAGEEPGQPEYIPDIEQAHGLAHLVAEILITEAVNLAEPGEFFLNREYARAQIELVDRVMELLGDSRGSADRRSHIVKELAARTKSTPPSK
jgi:hypothetical protein